MTEKTKKIIAENIARINVDCFVPEEITGICWDTFRKYVPVVRIELPVKRTISVQEFLDILKIYTLDENDLSYFENGITKTYTCEDDCIVETAISYAYQIRE